MFGSKRLGRFIEKRAKNGNFWTVRAKRVANYVHRVRHRERQTPLDGDGTTEDDFDGLHFDGFSAYGSDNTWTLADTGIGPAMDATMGPLVNSVNSNPDANSNRPSSGILGRLVRQDDSDQAGITLGPHNDGSSADVIATTVYFSETESSSGVLSHPDLNQTGTGVAESRALHSDISHSALDRAPAETIQQVQSQVTGSRSGAEEEARHDSVNPPRFQRQRSTANTNPPVGTVLESLEPDDQNVAIPASRLPNERLELQTEFPGAYNEHSTLGARFESDADESISPRTREPANDNQVHQDSSTRTSVPEWIAMQELHVPVPAGVGLGIMNWGPGFDNHREHPHTLGRLERSRETETEPAAGRSTISPYHSQSSSQPSTSFGSPQPNLSGTNVTSSTSALGDTAEKPPSLRNNVIPTDSDEHGTEEDMAAETTHFDERDPELANPNMEEGHSRATSADIEGEISIDQDTNDDNGQTGDD
ncbi:unnamed protein product [Periconia digitata]|uniref:Uncharacterized protein n=1 Tax=Periconia digitata TaxID=1303443 RepID=A0A9W4U1J8_9PLEO|nr:unnamed protein product [Periconia digitata]